MLVIASGDQQRGPRHGADGLDGRIRVGPLGIVIVGDSEPLPHELDPVLHRLKGHAGLADHRDGHAHLEGDGHSCHHIFMVVAADDLEILDIQHRLRLSAVAVYDPVAVHIYALVQLFPPAEVDHLAL